MEQYNLPESRVRWKEYNGMVFKSRRMVPP